MKLVIDNNQTLVESATTEQLTALRGYLSAERTAFRKARAPKGQPRQTEVTTEMVSVMDRGRFPTGLLQMVRKFCKSQEWDVDLDDRRRKPCEPELDVDLGWLRDHQTAAVERIAQRGGRGLVKAPTGAGKTEVAVACTRVYNCEWLLLVDSADLTEQAALRFERRTGERAGVWTGWARGWRRGTSNFTVATFQSLHRAISDMHKGKKVPPCDLHIRDLLNSIEGLMVDEVHIQSADTYYNVTSHLAGAYYRIGMSGTPLEPNPLSNLLTLGAIGPLLHEVPRQELVDKKLLSESTVHMIPCKQPASKSSASWRDVYDWWVVQSDVRNRVLAEMAVQAAKPAMLFVDEHKHIALIKGMLEARQLKVDVATGETWQAQRKEKLEKLESGETQVLIANVVFQKGIDCPKLRSVINGAGKQAAVAVIQRIGRGMRVDVGSNKYHFEVWDVFDQGQRWLQKHAKERCDIYQREGHRVVFGWDGIELVPTKSA